MCGEFTIYSNSTYVDLTCVYMYYSFIYILLYILLYIILYIILIYILSNRYSWCTYVVTWTWLSHKVRVEAAHHAVARELHDNLQGDLRERTRIHGGINNRS